MNTQHPPAVQRRSGVVWIWIFLILPACLLLLGVLGLASYFWQSGDTRALRTSVEKTLSGPAHWKVHLNAGQFTFGAVRLASHFVPELPREARAGLQALRGAEVGVYDLSCSVEGQTGRILSAADAVMAPRGWERTVGVATKSTAVAIYLPKRQSGNSSVKATILVADKKQLVLVKGRAELEPVMDIASEFVQQTIAEEFSGSTEQVSEEQIPGVNPPETQ